MGSAMALSKIGCFENLSRIFSRMDYKGNNFLIDVVCLRKSVTPKYLDVIKTANIHFYGANFYPEAPRLLLPDNICEIFHNETSRFTPERARDIAAPIALYGSGFVNVHTPVRAWNNQNLSSEYWGSYDRTSGDAHVNSYDCFSIVSLNSSMQSNVPKPYCSAGKSMHLNMPGGQWAIDDKYIAEYMQKSHYAALKKSTVQAKYKTISSHTRANYSTDSPINKNMNLSQNENNTSTLNTENLSNKDKLKRALRDYGCTVVVFHIGISLMSLGICYILISSGLDIAPILKLMGVVNEKLEGLMTQSSTFLVAYALHKLFAPIRISITLSTTPFIVRYLRKIGFLTKKKYVNAEK